MLKCPACDSPAERHSIITPDTWENLANVTADDGDGVPCFYAPEVNLNDIPTLDAIVADEAEWAKWEAALA